MLNNIYRYADKTIYILSNMHRFVRSLNNEQKANVVLIKNTLWQTVDSF